MEHENQQRQEIRTSFDNARAKVRAFTGLYSDEDLANEVLSVCDEVMVRVGTSPRLAELRGIVEARCRRLAEVTDRFSIRDPVVIAAARLQVIVAIDQIQDAALERVVAPTPPSSHSMLRRRSR